MAASLRRPLQWIDAGQGPGAGGEIAAAPGELEHGQDFLRVGEVAFSSRANRWKWSGFRSGRAPHGFEGVSASRAAAARAAEEAYFGD